MHTRKFLSSLLFAVIYFHSFSQNVLIKNKGLEGEPQRSVMQLDNWFDCGFVGHSPLDIHPGPDGGFWNVSKMPSEGKTYAGLVVRDDETYECFGQKLKKSLQKSQCYSWSVNLAQAENYLAMHKSTTAQTKFDGDVVLRLWGGNRPCQKTELLVVSPIISNKNWHEFTFQFQPKDDYKYILISAYYAEEDGVIQYCNGHILIDGLSDFIAIYCTD